MMVKYAKLSANNKASMAKYWQYRIDRAFGKIPEHKMDFKIVPISPEAARAWSRFLYGKDKV